MSAACARKYGKSALRVDYGQHQWCGAVVASRSLQLTTRFAPVLAEDQQALLQCYQDIRHQATAKYCLYVRAMAALIVTLMHMPSDHLTPTHPSHRHS